MIRKCNTSHSKQNYTPYNAIKISQFTQNQQQYADYDTLSNDLANDELTMNIIKIKECKKQTEEFVDQMNKKINQQNQSIIRLQYISRAQRERCRSYRTKYQEALINLRRKEEQNERLQRYLNEFKEKYEFMMNSTNNSMRDWLQREQKYQEQISQLQQIIHQQTPPPTNSPHLPHQIQKPIYRIEATNSQSFGKFDEESTFI